MDKPEFLKKYSELNKENLELPIDIIGRALSKWSTTNGQKKDKNGKLVSDGKYYESFDTNNLESKEFTVKDQVNQCTKANHYLYDYYKNRITNNGGEPSESINQNIFNYLELVDSFLTDGDVIYALSIIDIVNKLAEKALHSPLIIKEKEDSSKLNSFINLNKKTTGDHLNFVLLESIGNSVLAHDVPIKSVEYIFNEKGRKKSGFSFY